MDLGSSKNPMPNIKRATPRYNIIKLLKKCDTDKILKDAKEKIKNCLSKMKEKYIFETTGS